MPLTVTPGNHGPSSLLLGLFTPDGTLNFVDLTQNFQGIIISSSLHSPNISCQLRINDPVDLLGQLKITGEEVIVCTWQTPNFNDSKPAHKERLACFRLTRIDNVTIDKETNRVQSYNLSGVHELAYVQQFSSVDNFFSGTVSDAAKKVFDKALNKAEELGTSIFYPKKCKFTVDETNGVNDFIIPSETPFDTMSYLQSWAQDTGDLNTNLFLFYQDLEGYNFRNLDNLVMETYPAGRDHHTYRYDPIVKRQGIVNPLKAEEILQIKQVSRFNAYKHASDGNLHTSVATVDYLSKSVERTDLKYELDKSKLGPAQTLYPVEKDYLEKFAKESNSTDWLYVNKGLPNFIDNSSSHLKKKVLGTIFFNNIVQIVIPGNSSLDVGQVLRINTFKPNIKSSTGQVSEEDKDINGNYLIKDILHDLKADSYYQVITLCRTGKEPY